MNETNQLRGPIVIVGAGGFIGRALASRLAERGMRSVAVTRRAIELPAAIEQRTLGVLSPATDWAALLAGAGAVIHLASRAHVPLSRTAAGWIDQEVATARALATAATAAKVERIVFCSSVKVMGDGSGPRPFRADQPPHPDDAYGAAKLAIEQAMREIAPRLVVLRPPLVYGPGVKANFRALIRLVDRGLPLPFASVANRRSYLFIENLLDLIETALIHPEAPGGTFLLRDAETVSTPDLIRRIARALGRKPRLWPCPPALLQRVARLAGRQEMAERLLGTLDVDDSPTRQRLGWRPRFSLDEGLAATCAWYRRENGSATGNSRL